MNLKVGDKVQRTRSAFGVITSVDEHDSELPYRVDFGHGNEWCEPDEIEAFPEPAPEPPPFPEPFIDPSWSDRQNRQIALSMAVDFAKACVTAGLGYGDVVETARAFEEFLKGEAS